MVIGYMMGIDDEILRLEDEILELETYLKNSGGLKK